MAITVPIGPIDPKFEELLQMLANPAGLQKPMRPRSQPLSLSDLASGAGLPPPATPMSLGPLSVNAPPLTGPSLGAAPELPPTAPLPAADAGFIDRYSGPAPVAPVVSDPSTLDKIVAALGGFSAGARGQGAEYAEQIRQQREAPFRRYERQQEQYQDRRTRAFELDTRRRERQQEIDTRQAERQAEREFNVWQNDRQFMNQTARDQAERAFRIEQDAKRAREEIAEQQRREQRQREVDAKQIENQYFGLSKNRMLSRELGAYWSGLKESLSPAAARLDQQLAGLGQVRMRQAAGGGAGGGRTGASNAAVQALERFNQAKQALIGAIQKGDGKSADAYRETMNRAYKSLARFPGQIRLVTSDPNWPYAELIGAGAPTAAAQPTGKVITRAEMAALGITEAQARAEGYTIQ